MRLGEHNLESDDDGANPLDIPILNNTLLMDYDLITYQKDIALIVLPIDIEFTCELQT